MDGTRTTLELKQRRLRASFWAQSMGGRGGRLIDAMNRRLNAIGHRIDQPARFLAGRQKPAEQTAEIGHFQKTAAAEIGRLAKTVLSKTAQINGIQEAAE